MSQSHQSPNPITLTLGHEELVIRQRYEVASIINDILIAVWFIAGSVLFFFESTVILGTWFFVLGSIELLIRPMIRLSRKVHLQRSHGTSSAPSDASHDY